MERGSEFTWRSAIEQAVGFPIRDRYWRHLVEEGKIKAFQQGEKSLDELLEDILRLHRTLGSTVPIIQEAPAMITDDASSAIGYSPHEEALSRVFADLMKESDAVRSFRDNDKHGLINGVLPWNEMASYISRMDGNDGRLPTWWFGDVPYNAKKRIPKEIRLSAESGIESYSVSADLPTEPERYYLRLLRFGLPGDTHAHVLPIHEGTTLDALQRLSQHLARVTPWMESQATVFVLTGLPPLIAQVRVDTTVNWELPALSRMVFSIEPTMSPREVADTYRELRRKLVGERHRELTEKHTNLALFGVKEPRGLSRTQQMEDWNRLHKELHPDWAYDRESIFVRDLRQAQRRLLGREMDER